MMQAWSYLGTLATKRSPLNLAPKTENALLTLEAESPWAVPPTDMDGVGGEFFELVCSAEANSSVPADETLVLCPCGTIEINFYEERKCGIPQPVCCFNEFVFFFPGLEFSSGLRFAPRERFYYMYC